MALGAHVLSLDSPLMFRMTSPFQMQGGKESAEIFSMCMQTQHVSGGKTHKL